MTVPEVEWWVEQCQANRRMFPKMIKIQKCYVATQSSHVASYREAKELVKTLEVDGRLHATIKPNGIHAMVFIGLKDDA